MIRGRFGGINKWLPSRGTAVVGYITRDISSAADTYVEGAILKSHNALLHNMQARVYCDAVRFLTTDSVNAADSGLFKATCL